MSDELLIVKNLKKHFDVSKGIFKKEKSYVYAVDGLSFTVRKGEVLGIVGECGCGKSTTGNMIGQLLKPTEGEIIYEGQNFSQLTKSELRKKRADIQMIYQDNFYSLYTRIRVVNLLADQYI